MSSDELERVRADLAVMKGVCSEPALPREEIAVSLIVGVCGLLLAAGAWLVPLVWLQWTTLVIGVGGLAIYVPWKWRIIRREGSSRRWDVKEFVAWGIAVLGVNGFLLLRPFVFHPEGGYTPALGREDGAAAFFFIGLGILAGGMLHATRRPMIATGLVFMAGGIVYPFATTAAEGFTLVGMMMAVGCLSYAAWMALLARGERREHVGH
jgi:hypothetical protein